MFLIVGLGNPGKNYNLTRHNLGFLFLDYLKENYSFGDFKLDTKLKGELSSGVIEGEKVLLLKPSTFMNLSGQSLELVMNFYKIESNHIIVVYDDISMDFGKVRTRNEGSAGGHNGVKSIIGSIGNIFTRIKFGVGLDERYDVSDWVLSKFSKLEFTELRENGWNLCEQELIKVLKTKE